MQDYQFICAHVGRLYLELQHSLEKTRVVEQERDALSADADRLSEMVAGLSTERDRLAVERDAALAKVRNDAK